MREPSRLRRTYAQAYAWAAERLYHELAWAYEVVAWLVSFGKWDVWRRQVLAHVVGERVLEIGFGTGVLLGVAAGRFSVVGLDPSPEMHRVAGRHLVQRRLAVPRVQGKAQALPFAAGSFDSVIVTFPTGYIFDPDTLAAIARVLSADVDGRPGRCVITGLGSRSDYPVVQRAHKGLLGGAGADAVAWFAEQVTALGFRVVVVDDAASLIRMPVLILEPLPTEVVGRGEGAYG
ncbi:MAG: class I SAM-dependent methyltransferase [Anaerolineae bacterium]|nr:class I SAM-dependent methyltransferase [Anaerolineae bacterium]